MQDPVQKSLYLVNNTTNLYNDGRYYYYYYNLKYYGTIKGRRYNIRNVNDRKAVYTRISNETSLHPHPPTLLNKTPNRNCYFDMSKYFEIYLFMTKKFNTMKKVDIFWDYFKFWFSFCINSFI